MQSLAELRESQRLTQEELSQKSGLSVRTIQRIESGQKPKGYTLKALSQALGVDESYFEDKARAKSLQADTESDFQTNLEAQKWTKIINLSALPFIFLPPLNILVPLGIMYAKKQNTALNQKLISIQLVWALIALVIFAAILIMNDMLLIKSNVKILIPMSWSFINGILIIRNALIIGKQENHRIFPNINIL